MAGKKHPLSPEQMLEHHKAKYGQQISKTLLDINESFFELESDPGLFELLIGDLLGPDKVDVTDCYTMEAPFRSHADEDIFGIIFLYKVNNDRNQRRYDKDLQQKFVRDEAIVNGMFFPHQKVDNACATYAALAILLNSPNLPLGERLTAFKEFTANMNPEAKGLAVGNSADMAVFHNRRASAASNYSACVNAKLTSSSRPSAGYVWNASTVDAFHYVTYLVIDNVLFELDGLKEYPISHGSVSPGEDWTEKCRTVVRQRMKEATPTVLNNVLIVKASQRAIAIREMAAVQTKLSDAFQSLIDMKADLGASALEYPDEFPSFLETFQARIPLSARPEEVPINLPQQPEDLLSHSDMILDFFHKAVARNKADLLEAEEKLAAFKRETGTGLTTSFTEDAARCSSPALPGQSCASLDLIGDDDIPLARVKGEEPEEYAPGYSLRSRTSSLSASDVQYPAKSAAWPQGQALPTEAKTEVLEEFVKTLGIRSRKTLPITKRQKTSHSVHSSEIGTTPPSRREPSVIMEVPAGADTHRSGPRTRRRQTAIPVLSVATGMASSVTVSPFPGPKLKLSKGKEGQWVPVDEQNLGKRLAQLEATVRQLRREGVNLQKVLNSVETIKVLEEERVTLYGKIVEANAKKTQIAIEAEDREVDSDDFIPFLLKRLIELPDVLTEEDVHAILPMGVPKKRETAPLEPEEPVLKPRSNRRNSDNNNSNTNPRHKAKRGRAF
ncbi:putative Ubiquitin carboxyl-terminal hydrolase BAP1 [Hypsibius exemplaris]|uniref:ubiquitinyl hydrolase 1 n=1 Tax=Hypsibius exemplaris TaxID=2072580 RepID=A0A1W0XBI2_HYPEX|nr:putative Ubiquitin carboxyl-terminal hydrolase BAP1 [Hypsibius exemplaris]